MKRFLPFLALAATALIALPVFAESAATDTSATLPVDATGTTDAGVSDTGSSQSDAGSVDAVTPPNDTTGTSEAFNVNPCWDKKCPAQTKKCKEDKNCSAFIACQKTGKSATDCGNDLGLDEASSKALNALLTPMQECGWKECADPTKGTCKDQCGKYLGRSAPCNCDDECKKYGDCCADYDSLCGGSSSAGSCKGKCGEAPTAQGECGCDDQCTSMNDCCADYKDECGGSACQPSCNNKQCGDDGCGGTCGSCDADSVCDATNQCVKKAPKPDAGGSTDTGSTPVDAGATATDAGATVKPTPAKAADSSGCTAAPTSNGALPFGIVLVLLAGAVLLRRRDA